MPYHSVELFVGCGGLTLGFEKAGIKSIALVEKDKNAFATLKINRPKWFAFNHDIIPTKMKGGRIDILAGGFPCQSYSSAGKRRGIKDKNGQLFYQVIKIATSLQPLICVCENVKGFLNDNKGKTLKLVKKEFRKIGYTLIDPQVLNAIGFNVPQYRERIFLIAVRNDIETKYEYPTPNKKIHKIKDALKRGRLYETNIVPDEDNGYKYSDEKKKIMALVPPGGNWTSLSRSIQRKYMGNAFGKKGMSGMARRLSYEEPSTTLTTSPYQKLTDKCHPTETRPLTVREYARLQTFPDDWKFSGAIGEQYKQIGNAVPVNLAYAVGKSVVNFLNNVYIEKGYTMRDN